MSSSYTSVNENLGCNAAKVASKNVPWLSNEIAGNRETSIWVSFLFMFQSNCDSCYHEKRQNRIQLFLLWTSENGSYVWEDQYRHSS